MLNTRQLKKIGTMTRIAVYEEEQGIRDRETDRYFQTDYIFSHMFGSFITYTAACILIAVMAAGYDFENLLTRLYSDNLPELIGTMLRCYIMWLIPYLLITFVVYLVRFQKSQESLQKYRRLLGELSTYNED